MTWNLQGTPPESTTGDIIDDIARKIHDQPPPKPSTGDVWALVIADMVERRRVGIERYGMPVQPHNGRRALVDAYQEALDLAVYLRQAIEERESAMTAQGDVAAERERCATIAEAHSRPVLMDGMSILREKTVVANALDIADAIRGQRP